MSPKAATEVVADSRIAAPIDRGGAAERAARVDAWQAVEATFAFALASNDGDTGWLDRLTKAAGRIRELTAHDPDVALYMMLQKASNDVGRYGASHSMFCALVADLCAAHFDWPPVEADALRNAALTMNVGMLEMQDAMVHSIERPSPAQDTSRLERHSGRSRCLPGQVGIPGPDRCHHAARARAVSAGQLCPPCEWRDLRRRSARRQGAYALRCMCAPRRRGHAQSTRRTRYGQQSLCRQKFPVRRRDESQTRPPACLGGADLSGQARDSA